MFGLTKFEKRVKELEESLERIEHSFKKLEIEWAETYDKFKQLHWRVAKRVKTLERSSDAEGSEETEALPQTSSLTSHQEEVQRRIMARRNRNGG
jgi:chromosome segregation ATPase